MDRIEKVQRAGSYSRYTARVQDKFTWCRVCARDNDSARQRWGDLGFRLAVVREKL